MCLQETGRMAGKTAAPVKCAQCHWQLFWLQLVVCPNDYYRLCNTECCEMQLSGAPVTRRNWTTYLRVPVSTAHLYWAHQTPLHLLLHLACRSYRLRCEKEKQLYCGQSLGLRKNSSVHLSDRSVSGKWQKGLALQSQFLQTVLGPDVPANMSCNVLHHAVVRTLLLCLWSDCIQCQSASETVQRQKRDMQFTDDHFAPATDFH